MQAITRGLVLYLVLNVTLSLQTPSTISASDSESPTLVQEEAASYSIDFAVSMEEAIRRLSMQRELSELRAAARLAVPSRFAGAWIEHTPTFRVVLRFTGGSEGLGPVYDLASAAPTRVDVMTGAEHSLDELVAGLDRLGAVLSTLMPAAASDIDVPNGMLVVSSPSVIGAETIRNLRDAVGVPLRSEIADPVVPLVGASYGGMKVVLTGASAYSICTTGFSVQNSSGVKGVTTAAHCGDSVAGDGNIMYHDLYNNTAYRTYYQAAANDNDQDIQWMKESLHPTFPRFWIGGPTPRNVTLVVTSDMLGDYVCHYGVSTGNSCGSVASQYFDPGNICGDGNDDCLPAWIKVTGSSLKCAHGDSGGPLYHNTYAYGTLQAGDTTPPCSVATFMRMDRFTMYPMNLSVLIAP